MTDDDNKLSSQQIAFINTPIKYLQMSTRVTNFFAAQGFLNFSDILHLHPDKIKSMPNVGSLSMIEMSRILRLNGLDFMYLTNEEINLSYYEKNDPEKFKEIKNLMKHNYGFETQSDEFSTENNNFNKKQIAFLNISYTEFKLNVRLLNFFKNNNFKNFGDIIFFERGYIKTLKNIGSKSLIELEDILDKYGLYFGIKNSCEYKLDYYKINKPDEYVEIKELIEDISFTSFENFDFNELGFDSRDITIFNTRIIGNKTLQNLADEFKIQRERIRQVERDIFTKILAHLGHNNVLKHQKQFAIIFNKTEKLINKTDLILNLKIYRGIEKFKNFENLVTKLSEYVSKQYPEIPSILHEVIDNQIVFYPSTKIENYNDQIKIKDINNLSFVEVQKTVKEEFNKIKEFTLTDESKIKLFIEDKLRKVGRPDLLGCIDLLTKPLLSSDKLVYLKAFMTNQKMLLSKKEIYNLLIDDPIIFKDIVDSNDNKFRYISRLVDELENCYEFEYAKYGLDSFFGIVSDEDRNIIAEKLYAFMSTKPKLQFSTASLLEHVSEIIESNNIKFLSSELELNEYQVSWILKKDHRLNSKFFYLGRGIWSLEDNQKREEIKYVISAILEKEKKPLSVKELLFKIEEIRQLRNPTISFMNNYIFTHCENLSLITENGENKVVLNSWLKDNNYTLHIGPTRGNFDDLKTLIKEYIIVNGHSNMSSTYTLDDGRVLGRKIYHFRKKYHNNELDLKTIEKFESINGWTWHNYHTRSSPKIDYNNLAYRVNNFITNNGHAKISSYYKDEDGYSLGNRIYKLKQRYFDNTLSKEVIEIFENINNWTWNFNKQDPKQSHPSSFTYNKDHIKDKIVNYIKEYGHCNINTKYKDKEGYALGMAVYSLRRKYEEENLSEDIIQILNNIEGWDWGRKKRSTLGYKVHFNDIINKISKFIDENGHSNMNSNYRDEDGYKLGNAVYTLRRKYNKGDLDSFTIETLSKINGWKWDFDYNKKASRININFTDQIKLIKRYQIEFGNLKAKQDKEIYGVNLGRIIARFRERYKKGILDKEFITELELIDGWEWVGKGKSSFFELKNSNDIFKFLDKYYIEHGNFDFPVSYKVAEIKIGEILYNIKRRYKKDPQSIDPDLIKKFESYSCWSWEHHKKAIFKYNINEIIEEIESYRNKFGNIKIHRNYEANGIKLGQFLDRCKREYNAGKLKSDTIEALDKIDGWVW